MRSVVLAINSESSSMPMANLPAHVASRMLVVHPGNKCLEVPIRITAKEALEGVTLNSVIKHHGEYIVANTLQMLLAETVDTLSCNHPSGTRWVELFVSDWMMKYPTETVEDFALFMQKIRTSAYGPLYAGRLDSAVLFERFQKYMAEKVELRERTVIEEQRLSRLASEKALAQEVEEIDPEARKKISEQLAELSHKHLMHKVDMAREVDPKRVAHMAAGIKAAADCETGEQLLDALRTYPYDDVQNALQDRAKELGITLPTRQEIINAARQLAKNVHKGSI